MRCVLSATKQGSHVELCTCGQRKTVPLGEFHERLPLTSELPDCRLRAAVGMSMQNNAARGEGQKRRPADSPFPCPFK